MFKLILFISIFATCPDALFSPEHKTDECKQKTRLPLGIFRRGLSFNKMSMGKFGDNEQACLYAQFRPTYPDTVYTTIIEYLNSDRTVGCSFELAVDVGCGSGQSTVPLCKCFKHVIGYDVSEQQIKHAPKGIENATFKVGPGEDLGFLEDCSTDLITSAQAVHWLDRDEFYKEVRRALRPGGVCAAYGYGISILDKPEAQRINVQFYNDYVYPYLHESSKLCYDHYRNIEHPFENSELIENDEISIKRKMPLEAYIGFLASASSWRKYLQSYPSSDILDKLKERYQEIYKGDCIGVTWPVFILIGRKPF